jgi:hypothetical protein
MLVTKMYRQYARIKASIWTDIAFCALSGEAQHLYFKLLTHPSLDFTGVADWRPPRLAAMSGNMTVEDVLKAGRELEEHRYILVDPGTEEVFIRSFVRNDNVLAKPNIAINLVKRAPGIASSRIKAALFGELARLVEENPGLAGVGVVAGLLDDADQYR